MKEKLKAFTIHLSISFCVGLLFSIIIFFIWYPSPLAKATGVTTIFLILLFIDVIIGPLLTFIVYQKNKKTLKFDLICIAVIQVAALIYGFNTVYQGKPAWLVFNADRADIVRINELDLRKIAQAKNEYKGPSLFSPQWVAAKQPEDIKEKNDITFEAVFAGIDIAQRPELYSPIIESKLEIKSKALNLNELFKYNDRKVTKDILEEYPKADAYLPLKANAVDMTVLVNKETGAVIKIVDLRPWK